MKKKSETIRKISIAPMVDVTDTHFRNMCRILTKKAVLYTEMTTDKAIINGDHRRLLYFDEIEKPIAVQIAGSDPKEMKEATEIVENYDFDEINLNIGCPSNKVSEYKMGAYLMAYPDIVGELADIVSRTSSKEVTVKHRLGIDGRGVLPDEMSKKVFDSYEDLKNFVEKVSRKGPRMFIIHARIAVLNGLDPKKNRNIPKLRYEDIYRLKREIPEISVEINGGIRTISEMMQHLKNVDSVMLGRIAYENPVILSFMDDIIDGKRPKGWMTRRHLIDEMIRYTRRIEEDYGIESRGNAGSTMILRHMFGIFHGKKGSRKWKQKIMPPYKDKNSASEILENAKDSIDEDILDEIVEPEDFM